MRTSPVRTDLFLCLAMFTLALTLRASVLTANSLWSDEHCSVRGALGQIPEKDGVPAVSLSGSFTPEVFWRQNTLPNVIRATFAIENGNSLVYNVALHFWYGLFGFSEVSSRALSVVFGLATVVLSFWFVRTIFQSTRLAGLTAFCVAIHPFLVTYSREVRSYSLALFFGLLASFAFFMILRSRKAGPPLGWCFLYFVGVTLSVFSHYLALYLYLAHGICALFYARSLRRFAYFAVPMLAFGTLFALWWFMAGGLEGYGRMAEHGLLWKQRSLTTMPELKTGWQTTPHWLMEAVANVFNLRSALTNKVIWNSSIPFHVLSLLTVVAYGIGIFSVIKRRAFEKHLIYCVGSMALICPLIGLGMALQSGLNLTLLHRFSICSIPFGLVLVALAVHDLSRMPKWTRAFVGAMAALQLVVFTSIALRAVYGHEELSRRAGLPGVNRYLEVARSIDAVYKPGDVVIYSNAYDANMVSLYLGAHSKVQQRVDLRMESERVILKGKSGTVPIADSSLPPS